MKNIKIRHRIIPLWFIAILLLSEIGVGVSAYYVWNKLTVPRRLFGDKQDYSQLHQITTIEWRILGIKAVCPDQGIAESVTALLLLDRGNNEPTEPFRVKCALYIEQADSIVKYAETETRELWEETNPVPILYTFNFPHPNPSLENRNYWILALAQLVPGFPYVYYDGIQGILIQTVERFQFPDVLPNPLFYNASISIYCTYSLTGPLRTPFMIAFMAASVIAPLLVIILYRRKRHTLHARF